MQDQSIGTFARKRLIYASTATRSPELMLLDIVRVAEERNAAMGISGILCYSPERYVQLIDGPSDAVDQLWHSIRKDSAHRILWDRALPDPKTPISRRLPMGYASFSQMDDLGIPPFDIFRTNDPTPEDVTTLADTLERIAYALYARTLVSSKSA